MAPGAAHRPGLVEGLLELRRGFGVGDDGPPAEKVTWPAAETFVRMAIFHSASPSKPASPIAPVSNPRCCGGSGAAQGTTSA